MGVSTCSRQDADFGYLFLVGIGRPFLYAFSTYGTEGVDHALQILHVRPLFPPSHPSLSSTRKAPIIPGLTDMTNAILGRVRDEHASHRRQDDQGRRPGDGRRV